MVTSLWFDYLAGRILCILAVYSLSTTPQQVHQMRKLTASSAGRKRAPYQQCANITNCKRAISQEDQQAMMHSRGAQACSPRQLRDVLTSLKPNVTGKWYCGRRRNYRAATAAPAAKVGSDGILFTRAALGHPPHAHTIPRCAKRPSRHYVVTPPPPHTQPLLSPSCCLHLRVCTYTDPHAALDISSLTQYFSINYKYEYIHYK